MEEGNKQSIIKFILKICSLERFIELSRQFLCDKDDFQPYVAFMRINRDSGSAITPSMLHKFLADNLVEVSLRKCQILVEHYDADKDGVLSYKEFIEILLPKEHPELRSFVTQQECFNISKDEYLSYETEGCLASLLEKELFYFDESQPEREDMMLNQGLSVPKIMDCIDTGVCGNINFNNLQQYFNKCGLLPYDAELINFLRRLDKDDDGVVNQKELELFLSLYESDREPFSSLHKSSKGSNRGISSEKIRRQSPNRKIVGNKVRHGYEEPVEPFQVSRTSIPNPSRESQYQPENVQRGPRTYSNTQQRPYQSSTRRSQAPVEPQPQELEKNDRDSKPQRIQRSTIGNSDSYTKRLESQISQRKHTPKRGDYDEPIGREARDQPLSHTRGRDAEPEYNRRRTNRSTPYEDTMSSRSPHRFTPSDTLQRNNSTTSTRRSQNPGWYTQDEGRAPQERDSQQKSNIFKTDQPTNRDSNRWPSDMKKSSASINERPNNVTRSTSRATPQAQPQSNPRENAKRPSQGVESRSSETIYKAFKMILNQERNLELARRELVTKNDFDVTDVFKRIDKKGRNWFTIEDFRIFLTEIGLKNIDTRALIDLYSSYDTNQSCLLNFEQLVNMVCPLDNRFAAYLNKVDRRDLSEATTELLADVFNRQFSLRKSLVDAKRLIKQENLDLNIIFELIDTESKGSIGSKEVEFDD